MSIKVAKIKVGVPINNVVGGALSINNLPGVNTNGVVDGNILVYDANNSVFITSPLTAEVDNINNNIDAGFY